MSDGTKMKLALAAVMARDTDLLVLDEPGSSLDPLMRDRLCGMFRKYLAEKDGQRSVIFSTHNISDMESVADYAVIMADGKIIEKGFTEDLKDKYRIVNGSAENAGRVKDYMISFTVNGTIYEGLALKENADVLENMDAAVEIPDLQQISVELLRSAEEV
ncbi:MAG: AAA family ATPase, partial [Oscillospiraceae bacterium]|nr:AAA family ATPase [Oscillospiraceae bacterium]